METLLLLLATTVPAVIVASRLDGRTRWWGVIPPLHLLVLVGLTSSSRWWVLAGLIPPAHPLVAGLLWGRVAARAGQPRWLGWCTAIPFVGLLAPWVIALRARRPGAPFDASGEARRVVRARFVRQYLTREPASTAQV